MAISGVSSTASYNTSTDVYENPNGKLDSQDFFQLFLTELKYQDPTQPMDNDKILSQTAQLSQLESQTELKVALEAVVDNLNNSSKTTTQYSSIGAIGKTATSDIDTIQHTSGQVSNFGLFFENKIQAGSVSIYDNQNNIIKTMQLNDLVGNSGVLDFVWDGRDDSGNPLESGEYKVVGNYIDEFGNSKTTTVGTGLIESIKFDSGKTLAKINGSYIDMSKIKEIY